MLVRTGERGRGRQRLPGQHQLQPLKVQPYSNIVFSALLHPSDCHWQWSSKDSSPSSHLPALSPWHGRSSAVFPDPPLGSQSIKKLQKNVHAGLGFCYTGSLSWLSTSQMNWNKGEGVMGPQQFILVQRNPEQDVCISPSYRQQASPGPDDASHRDGSQSKPRYTEKYL